MRKKSQGTKGNRCLTPAKRNLFVIINPPFHIRTQAEDSGPESVKYLTLCHAKAPRESLNALKSLGPAPHAPAEVWAHREVGAAPKLVTVLKPGHLFRFLRMNLKA